MQGRRQFRGDAPTDTVASGSLVGAYLSDDGRKAAACHFHPGALVYFTEHVIGGFHVQVVGTVPFREDERGFGLSLFVDECYAFVAQDFKGDLGREQVFRQGGLYGSAGQDLLWQVDGHARQVEDFDLRTAHDVVHGQGDGLQSGCVPFDGVPVYHASVGVDLRTAQDGGLERDGPAYASFARQAQERYGLCRVLVDGREVRVGVPRVHRLHLYFIRLFGFQGRGGDGEARGRAVMHIARFARLCLVVGQVQG